MQLDNERPERMDEKPREDEAAWEALIAEHLPQFHRLPEPDRERLRQMAADLRSRGMPWSFVGSSVRSTAQVLADLREEEGASDNAFQREHVQRFIEQNGVVETSRSSFNPRRERKREERERLQAHAQRLLRDARQSRGRHEVKKTRNMLLKLDQRELRRVLGKEGDELCRQINTWLRSTAAMF